MPTPDETIDKLLFQTDTTIAYDWRQIHNARRPYSPEELLMLAVLEDAVEAVRGTRIPGVGNKLQDLYRLQDVHWFEDRDSDHLYSLNSICQHFGFDAEAIRKAALKSWEQLQRAKIEKGITGMGG